MRKRVLLEDDFSTYPVGRPVVPYYGLRRFGPWEARNIDYVWGPYDEQSHVWEIIADGPRQALAQLGDNFAAYICAGEDAWRDYTATAEFAFERRDTTRGSSFGCDHDQERLVSGLLFRYQTQRHHYFWGADREGHPLLARREEERLHELYRGTRVVPAREYHRWTVRVEGRKLTAFLDDQPIAESEDGTYSEGRIGFRTDRPMRIVQVQVITSEGVVPRRTRATPMIRPPVEYATLERPGRWHKVFAADLNGDGEAELIHVSLPVAGTEPKRGLEALDLRGRCLWQYGEWPSTTPSRKRQRILGTTVVIADSRILLGYNHRVELLDAASGRQLLEAELPFEVRSAARAGRLWLVMNAERLVALDDELRPRWSHEGNLGHHPWPCDVDEDGAVETMCGYSLLDANGRVRWSIEGLERRVNSDMLDAHNDFTVFGRFFPGDPIRIAVAASQKGFYLLEADGRIVRRQVIGHVQEVIPGRFVANVPGMQLMTNTLWESAGIYTLFDGRGNFLRRWELGVFSPMRRIEWPGCATDLLLLTDYDRRPALVDAAGNILWQADTTRFGNWWRLPGQGVCELPGHRFAVNYGQQLVIYGPGEESPLSLLFP